MNQENLITNLSPTQQAPQPTTPPHRPTKVGYLERFFGQHALQFSCCETMEVGEVRTDPASFAYFQG